MKTFTCGHCGGRHQDLEQVKACSQVANDTVGNTKDRVVTTTCGWGKSAHRWTAPLSEVVLNKNICPDHRG